MPLLPAYVAGIIDGEGCIGLSRSGAGVYPSIYVTNTNIDLLHALKGRYGGIIKVKALRKENWKEAYAWKVTWRSAVLLLEDVGEYLMLKKKQAETVFLWNDLRPGPGKRWDPHVTELLFNRMKWLNQRGPVSGSDPMGFLLSGDEGAG